MEGRSLWITEKPLTTYNTKRKHNKQLVVEEETLTNREGTSRSSSTSREGSIGHPQPLEKEAMGSSSPTKRYYR